MTESAVHVQPPTQRERQSAPERRVHGLPKWNVVLLDDDDHTYEYVIELMGKVFGYDAKRGYEIAREVDRSGRAVCLTTHRELAELKRDQIHAYGADWRLSRSRGAMRAVIEPAGS